jgi:hypothetical protein
MGMNAIKTGDTVTIRRGKLKGQSGTVLKVGGNGGVALEHTDGTISIQAMTNLRAPEEATIGAGALAEAFQESAVVLVHERNALAALQHVANRLTNDLPGLTIEWPKTTD